MQTKIITLILTVIAASAQADTQGPALTVASPTNDATVGSLNLTVSGMASDSGRCVDGIASVTVNGVGVTGGTATGANTANWSATVPISSGLNDLTVIAADTAGNSTTQRLAVTYNGLIRWHWRNPFPQGAPLQGIAYGDNQFVAVGEVGTILTSPHGSVWTSRVAGTPRTLNGITYGNNQFVAVGETGTILNSPDGSTWTNRASGTTNSLSEVAYGNHEFVALGLNSTTGYSTILGSSDGITWTRHPTTNDLNDITYGDNQFILVGEAGTILASGYASEAPFLNTGVPTWDSTGFHLPLAAPAGSNVVVQASTNLTAWLGIYTDQGVFLFTDPSATSSSHRFYRAFIP